MISSVVIENAAAKRVRAGERWFNEKTLIGRKPKLPGIVRLIDRRRQFVASAFCSPGSRTFLRVITTADVPIDRAFWRERLHDAWARRSRFMGFTDAFRVVYAESDGIPGIVIDRYDDCWTIQVTSAGAAAVMGEFVDIIVDDYRPAAVIEKNNISIRSAEGLPLCEGILFGTKSVTTIREGEEHFTVDLLSGQKTGAYLDYRSLRFAARDLARGRCLDAFCYQGWCACQMASKAERVTAIDASAPAIDAAQKNAALNGHDNIDCVRADVFDSLAACRDQYDFVHLDPPSFAKGGGQRAQAIIGYRKLLNLAIPVVAPNGVLMVSSCSHAVTERVLEEVVMEGAARAGRDARVVWRGIQDVDHPVLKGFPESLYLKALAVELA